jgi:hypothetical protein
VIVLHAGEKVLFQKEAKLKLSVKLEKGNIEGKGMLYITNLRIAFEDYKQGLLTHFAPSEILAYRKVKGLWNEKLCIDFLRNGMKNVMVAEFEFKGVDDAYKLLSMLTNNSNTSNNAIVGYNSNIQNNVYYNMVNTTSNNEIDDTPDWIKPWIADIKFTWDPDKRWRELGLKPFDDTKPRPWGYFKQYVLRIENDFKNYVKFDTSKFADDFKYKVAREAYKLRADFPYEHEITYDSNRYWVGVIEKAYKDGSDELVGININADSGSGFFIYNPKDWYDWFLIVVRFGYNYERNEPTLIGIGPYNKEDETKRLTLAKECKRYYFAILNKDFKTAEDAWRQISETYRKYDTENTWLDMTGTYGLVLKYAIEMDRRNIPYPTTVKRSPI